MRTSPLLKKPSMTVSTKLVLKRGSPAGPRWCGRNRRGQAAEPTGARLHVTGGGVHGVVVFVDGLGRVVGARESLDALDEAGEVVGLGGHSTTWVPPACPLAWTLVGLVTSSGAPLDTRSATSRATS